MKTIDDRKIDAFLTMGWLDTAAEAATLGSPAQAADPQAREQEAFHCIRLARATRLSRLGELAASIVHEVNQPLAAIRINGETGLRWLDREKPDLARARKSIERMLHDADRALDIISVVRAIAAGHATRAERLTLDDVIADAIAVLQHDLHSKDVVVDFDPMPRGPEINGHRLQLQQLVVNLLANAVQAASEGSADIGKVIVRTDSASLEQVSCSVEDNGPGIDPSRISCLFYDVFTTKKTGMGMGLLISRSIVEAHGGRISADNNSSLGGARFTFTLPSIADVKQGPQRG